MENTYIISDYSKWLAPLIEGLGLSGHILSYEELNEDWEFDEWIRRNIAIETTCLVIPIELGVNRQTSVQGLRLGMHLRLSENHLRYLPIVFVSNREDWQIRQMLRDNFDKDHLDYIIGTKGTDLIKPNIDDIKSVIENIQPLNENNYKSEFYDNIYILPLEETGNHSLANIWGALQLNKLRVKNDKSEVHPLNAIKDKTLTNRTKELYFKYLRAFHTQGNDTGNSPIIELIEAKDKKILLIDDQADKGWAEVLRAIFIGSDFHAIDFKTKSFDDAYKDAEKKINEEEWDLILLDLRLNPAEEEKSNQILQIEFYSGTKVLNIIKKINKGTQVIMLTASNKAWNMKGLFDLGADGYYVKESPEFNSPPSFTKENYEIFSKECVACLNKFYLQKLAKINQSIEKRLNQEDFPYRFEYLNERSVGLMKAYLTQAFNAIYKYSDTQKEYALYSFLDYYKIIELLNKDMIGENIEKFYIRRKRNNKIDFILKSPLLSKIKPIKNSDKSIEKYKLEDYVPIEEDEKFYNNRLSSSVQFSGLLLLRFGMDDNIVKKFIVLNQLRNSVVAHSAKTLSAEITEKDVIQLAELLAQVFQRL